MATKLAWADCICHIGPVTPPFATLPRHCVDAAFLEFDMHGELTIAGRCISFPWLRLDRDLQPREWFAGKLGQGSLHEPRLIDWLVELAGRSRGPIRFYDIGALFGFHTAIASAVFDEVEIVAVEPDPDASRYVESLGKANGIADLTVRQCLLGGQSGQAPYRAEGFLWVEDDAGSPVEVRTLHDILLRPDPAFTEILKIDAEGHQALFLSPAGEELIRREAILLLELDRPEKLAEFGTTNAAILQPFLDAGYRLGWCDHRDPVSRVEWLDSLEQRHERNSLAVLLPPGALP